MTQSMLDKLRALYARNGWDASALDALTETHKEQRRNELRQASLTRRLVTTQKAMRQLSVADWIVNSINGGTR